MSGASDTIKGRVKEAAVWLRTIRNSDEGRIDQATARLEGHRTPDR